MVRVFDLKDIGAIMEIWLHTNSQAHHFISESYWSENFDKVKKGIGEQ